MITFTFAGDEAGDVSLNFEKGASRYFVMAVIGTTQPDILRHTLDDVRQKSNLPPSYEFSFHTMTSTALRLRTFQALRTADFEAWALVVDKTQLPKSFRVMRRLDFYLLCITELIEAIPAEKREKATLILDEFGGEPRLPLEFRRFMKQRNIPRHFAVS